MRIFKILLLLIVLCLSPVDTIAGTYVDPINWSRFNNPVVNDTLLIKTRTLLQNAVKYFIHSYLDSMTIDSAGLYNLTAYPDKDHMAIREPAYGAAFIAITLATNSFDSTIVGLSKDSIRIMNKRLIKSLVSLYGTYWGRCWQCPMWAASAGFGAWLMWQDLDTETKTRVASMVEREANRFNNENPPYCNDCTDNTLAEENAWNSTVISLAVAMMPNHPNVNIWKMRTSQWMISSYARASDLNRNILIDGKMPKEWISGWNAREPGYVYNHGIMHPDYMMNIDQKLYALVFQSLANQIVPQASIFSFDVVYKCFVDYLFSVPPWRNPGGTIYRQGKAKVYYPEGTDWSIYCVDRFFEMDVFALLLPSVAANVSIHPAEWANIRADTLLWMQSRFTTGQHYAPGEWDANGQSPWKLGEFYGGFMIGASYIALWLNANNGLSPVGNWNLTNHDTIPPGTPSNVTAAAINAFSVRLNWSKVNDIGSGTAYYHVYRNDVSVGFTKDTFFVDENLRSSSEYRYRIAALDYNNNIGPLSNMVNVLTPKDTSELLLSRVNAIDSITIRVTFSKEIDSLSSVAVSNYTINGLSIIRAELDSLGNMVTLKVSSMTSGNSYELQVSNIADKNTPAKTIPPNSSIEYSYVKGLVLHWTFEESDSSTIFDMSKGLTDGLMNSGCHRSAGKYDRGIILKADEAGHLVLKGSRKYMHLDFPFTVSTWINTNDLSKEQTIVASEDATNTYFGFWMDIASGGRISINLGNGATPGPWGRKSKVTSSSITAGQWNHVAAVVNSINDMKIFINGSEATCTSSGDATNMIHSETSLFRVGKRVSAGTNLKFEGSMDDIRIYDVGLSKEEISHLFNDTLKTFVNKQSSTTQSCDVSANPNPFNPSVELSFTGDFISSNVLVSVFDIYGRLVCNLSKEAKVAKIIWNASNYPSGCYSVLIDNGKTRKTKKIIYLR